jgi:hypothetical protein
MRDESLGLAEQRLVLEESIAQMDADLEEAERQRTVAESLDKRHLSFSFDVARAPANEELLTRQLKMERERLALIEQQLARWAPVQEEVVLAAARMQLETC